MGTNFYLNYDPDKEHLYDQNKEHIGKRSAAGWFCWDCNITLCKDGPEGIHYSKSGWYDACPDCGKPVPKDGEVWFEGAAGRELGFNTKPFERKKGVTSCSSFTWAGVPEEVKNKALLLQEVKLPVKNEYGDEFSWDEFEKILEECPVQYFDSIGTDFS